MSVELKGKQIEALRDALVRAFPDLSRTSNS